MLSKIVFAVIICAAGYSRAQDSETAGFRFAAEAEDSLYQPLSRDFSCEGRDYGYYADIANNCQIFHICWPWTDDFGNSDTFHWSFLCGNQTVFDQSITACNHPQFSIPCEESEIFYGTVPFGDVDDTGK